ncbi:MAG: aspartate carbamoyltransferase catalytic subunit [Alphaproteobacteria bacterium]|nr:aspartate carbamoyltransferase catalytic subunit [Alphaproteobacteria bacterium]
MIVDVEADLIDARAGRDVGFFDLVSVDAVTPEDSELIFDVARKFRQHGAYKFPFNKGRMSVNAFFETSTRTMSSFDLSAKQLSMDTAAVGSNSSTSKGETYLDTAEVLDSYNISTLVVRSREAGVAEMLSRHVRCSVVNAGDGWHEHPTQALLDMLTMLDHFGGKDLTGKVVLIVGDIMHSRVFGSLARILPKLGAALRVAAPETFIPACVENFGVDVFFDVEKALSGADVVYALRVQEERGAAGFVPSLREYSKMFGISKKRLDMAHPKAILMHPGPVRRDIDVHSALVSVDERSHILRQVENGMAIRKTLLWLLSDRLDKRVKEFKRK